MPSTIRKCKLFRIKHSTLLEDETFLRNKQKITFFWIKCTFFWIKCTFFWIKCTFFNRKENTIKLFIVRTILYATVQTCTAYTTIMSSLFLSYNYLLDLYNGDFQDTSFVRPQLHVRHKMQFPPPLASANYLE